MMKPYMIVVNMSKFLVYRSVRCLTLVIIQAVDKGVVLTYMLEFLTYVSMSPTRETTYSAP